MTVTTTERSSAYARVLRQRAMPSMLVSHGAGTIAQQVVVLAVGAYVLQRTGSPIWTAVTVALGYVPYLLLSARAGVLVDRYSRVAVLRCSALVRIAVTAVLAAAMLADWAAPVIVLLTALTAVAATPAYPALAAGAVQCVDDADLPTANALATGVENIAWLIGPGVLGGLLLLGYGPTEAVVAAAVLFVVAWFALFRVGLPRAVPEAADDVGEGLLPVLRSLRALPQVRSPLLLAVVDNLLYGYLVVALVLLAAVDGPGSEHRLGLLNAALSAGALASLLVVNHLAHRRRARLTLVLLLCVFAGCIVLLGLAGFSVLGLAVVAIAGVATIVAEVLCVTQVQRATPSAWHGRVLGVYDTLAVGSVALGSLLAGLAVGALGAQAATASAGVIGLVLVLVSLRLPDVPGTTEGGEGQPLLP